MKEYALYRKDNLVMIGTAQEIAYKMRVKVATVRFYTSPAHLRRVKNGKIVIKIDESEDK